MTFLLSYNVYSQTNYSDVLVIINNNSPISDSVGSYFASMRNIPIENIVRIQAPVREEIDNLEFENIRSQIENHILQNSLQYNINYIVTTKGVPLKVNRGNIFSTSSPSSSLESELTLILSSRADNIGKNGFSLSPYFLSTQSFSKTAYDMYLVTRLDGYTFNDIKNLIDKSANPAWCDTTVQFVFDEDPTWNSSLPFLNNSLSYIHSKLISKGLKSTLENSTVYLTNQSNVIGYTSWGSNDNNANLYTNYGRPHNTWAPGAITETYVSTSGRTFLDPVFYGQSVIADLVAEGVTGAKGYVYEPYSNAMAIVWILFDRYTDGFNLAESFYMSSRALSWMDVIIGDPKMKINTPSSYSLPVQLASFTGSFVNNNKIKLEWTTISEINNYGFYVQKYDPIVDSFVTIESSFQPGETNSLVPKDYIWFDEEINGTIFQYKLLQIDNDGLEHHFGPISVNPTSVEEKDINTFKVNVLNNFPNPFNPSTEIQFYIEKRQKVSLRIYNSIGQEISTLINDNLEAGVHSMRFDGTNLPSGVYYGLLQTEFDLITNKMLLVK